MILYEIETKFNNLNMSSASNNFNTAIKMYNNAITNYPEAKTFLWKKFIKEKTTINAVMISYYMLGKIYNCKGGISNEVQQYQMYM